jgi:type I restriction enzyme S subunit
MSAQLLSTIGEIVEPISSWTPERDDPDGVFTYIDLSAVDQETKIVTGARKLSCAEAPSRARQLIRTGDVLVSTVRPNLNGVARIPPEFDGATVSTGFCVLRPRPDKLDGEYLFQWVKSPRFISEMVRRATGASYPAVSDRIVYESKLPLPPLPEQRRIAEILDKADALRAKRRAVLTWLDTLTQAIFLDMFGNPISNPRGWPQQDLKTFFYFRTGKLDSNATVPGGRYPFFTCSQENLQIDTFAFDCEALLLAGNNANADYSVKHYKGKFNAYQRTYVITLQNEHNSYDYAQFVLENRLAELKRISKGTNTKYLTLELLNRIRLPVPPVELQKRYRQLIAIVDRHRTANITALSDIEALFTSLQQRAFRGEM